jgi:hypothetical protein
MGLLDSVLGGLPRLGSATTTAVGSSSTINYSLAPVTTLVNEGYAKVNTTFGGTGPFTKMNDSAPSFAELGVARLGLPNLGPRLGQATSGTGSPYDQVAGAEAVKLLRPESGVTAAGVRESVGESEAPADESHKVRLIAPESSGAAEGGTGVLEVVFDVMPEVTEVRSAEYEPVSPSQLPGEFQKYKGTKSTQWNITGRLTASTKEEAARNYRYIGALRGWTMPYFGELQRRNFRNLLGAPPPVLTFSGWRGLVGPIPVVLTQINWNWPQEVDWLPTGITDDVGQEIPFPAVMNVTINLVESLSPTQFNSFDLVAFRDGRMVDAYRPGSGSADSVSVSEPVGGQSVVTNSTVTPVPMTSNRAEYYLAQQAAESEIKSGDEARLARAGGAVAGPPLPTGDEGE